MAKRKGKSKRMAVSGHGVAVLRKKGPRHSMRETTRA